jgi:hypothetical protein
MKPIKKRDFSTSSRSGSRGVSLMNRMEDKASEPVYLKNDKPVSGELKDKDKIRELVRKFPHNSFYQSLANWSRPYTEKQSSHIRADYDKHFRIEKIIEEHQHTDTPPEVNPDDCPF